MNIISFNICGMGSVSKRSKISCLCNKHCVKFLGIQETFARRIDLFKVRALWGNNHFDFVSSSARGHSGGILSIWDPSLFNKKRVVCTDNTVIMEGVW